MKSSAGYVFYPPHRPLERALAASVGLLEPATAATMKPADHGRAADNFLYTRGNFEQQRFHAAVLEPMRAALAARLTDDLRQQQPAVWAEFQNNLGNVLAALAQGSGAAEPFESALRCFNQALTVFTQAASPLDWAATQYNLGTAGQALGRQRSDARLLKTSIDAYTDALRVWSKEKNPFEWASAMHQLGATMHAHGKLLKGDRTLQKSVVAYKNALTALDADNYALELAATHNSRGVVLQDLGETEKNADRLEEAVRSYETALTVCMEQQLPIHLAVLCRINRSSARRALAELTNNASLASEVTDEFELIVECFPDALQPRGRAYCEEQMNKAKCAGVCA